MFKSANRIRRSSFHAIVNSALVNLSLDLIAKANPREGAHNPKTLRRRMRALKVAKGKIVAEIEKAKSKKVKTPKVKATAKPRAKRTVKAVK